MVTAVAASDRGIASVVFRARPPGRAPGRWPAPRRSRPTAARSTRRRSATGCATCAPWRPTAPATRAPTPYQPPCRQHRADRDDDRSRLAADRHRHRRRHAADGGSGLASVSLEYRSTLGGSGRTSAPRRPRRSRAPGTRRSSRTGCGTCGRSRPTSRATRRSRRRSFNRRVDNTAPTVSLTDPGTPLKGTVTLASTSGDGARQRRLLGPLRVQARRRGVDDRLHRRDDPVLVRVQHRLGGGRPLRLPRDRDRRRRPRSAPPPR